MSTDESDQPRVMLQALLKESGLEISDVTLDQIAVLYRRVASNRAKLAAVDLAELEPATIFPVDIGQVGRDDERR